MIENSHMTWGDCAENRKKKREWGTKVSSYHRTWEGKESKILQGSEVGVWVDSGIIHQDRKGKGKETCLVWHLECKLCQLWVLEGREHPWVVVLCGSGLSSPTSVHRNRMAKVETTVQGTEIQTDNEDTKSYDLIWYKPFLTLSSNPFTTLHFQGTPCPFNLNSHENLPPHGISSK